MLWESGFVTRQLSYRSDVTASNPVLAHRRNSNQFQTTALECLHIVVGLFIKQSSKHIFEKEREEFHE